MKKKKIVLATGNPDKKIEINKIIKSKQIEIIDCSDLNIKLDVEETGNSYKENAEIKARYVFEKTGLPSCADDSGIEIEFLNFEPGVKSARFLEHLSYPEKNRKIIQMLADTDKRFARYVCAIAYIDKDGLFYIEETCEGSIAYSSKGNKGFGYDPIFIPKNYDLTFGELSAEIKNQISHRAKAFKKLESKIC
jgi:XTP/dITP diphosphohydrolase